MLCPDIDDDKWVNLLLQKLSGELQIFMCYSWGRDTSSGSGSDIWAKRPGPWGVEIKEIWNSQTPSPAMNRMGWALRTLLVADNSSCLKDRKVSWVVRDVWGQLLCDANYPGVFILFYSISRSLASLSASAPPAPSSSTGWSTSRPSSTPAPRRRACGRLSSRKEFSHTVGHPIQPFDPLTLQWLPNPQ